MIKQDQILLIEITSINIIIYYKVSVIFKNSFSLVIKCSAQSLNEFTLVSTAEDVQPGTVVWYSCKLGYKLPNVEDGTRTCTLDGTWSNVAPECQGNKICIQ